MKKCLIIQYLSLTKKYKYKKQIFKEHNQDKKEKVQDYQIFLDSKFYY